MARITFIEHDGTEHAVQLKSGTSIMQGALDHAISGILAECGGGLACATCHCFIDDAWINHVGPASEAEQQMLEFSAGGIKTGSRLSCQVVVSDTMDGLIVRLPESQM